MTILQLSIGESTWSSAARANGSFRIELSGWHNRFGCTHSRMLEPGSLVYLCSSPPTSVSLMPVCHIIHTVITSVGASETVVPRKTSASVVYAPERYMFLLKGPVCKIQWRPASRRSSGGPVWSQCLVCPFWATVETWRFLLCMRMIVPPP